jgi:PAS domain S-box-containing protein
VKHGPVGADRNRDVEPIDDTDEPELGFPPGAVFRAAPDAVIVMGSDGRVRDWNNAAERMFGYGRSEAIGRELAELIIPGPLRDAHRNSLTRYLETGESTILDRRVELSGIRRDGEEVAVELTVTRAPGIDPPLFTGFLRDIPWAGQQARENARLQQRMTFLAQIGLALDQSLDFDETVRTLADLAVPDLAEIAVVDLLGRDGSVRTAVVAALEPANVAAVEQMRGDHPLPATSSHPVARALRSGAPVLLPVMTPEFLRGIAQGNEHYELMRALGYSSAIVVPLIARGHVLGALSLLRLDGAAPYNENDLVLGQELARRAALALDNSRLYESTRDLALTLQQSLLPRAFPRIPGVRLSGLYRPAAEGQEVGGDFYDAFSIDHGRFTFAIGDVCGKGPQAAALTALARYTIRALGDRDPASILGMLNDTVMRERETLPERYLTAVVATSVPRGDEWDLEIAAAGHPPPLVRRVDGSVEQVQASGLMIGVRDGARYSSTPLTLSRGDAIVLYTDGLTDARAPETIVSDQELLGLLNRARGMNADELASFLAESVTGDAPARDDIALLVVELSDDRAD